MNEHGCMIVSLERLKSRLNLFQVFKRTQGYFAPTLCYAIFQLLIECTGRGWWELGLPWRKQRGWIQMLVANLGTGTIQQAQNVCVLRSYLFHTSVMKTNWLTEEVIYKIFRWCPAYLRSVCYWRWLRPADQRSAGTLDMKPYDMCK